MLHTLATFSAAKLPEIVILNLELCLKLLKQIQQFDEASFPLLCATNPGQIKGGGCSPGAPTDPKVFKLDSFQIVSFLVFSTAHSARKMYRWSGFYAKFIEENIERIEKDNLLNAGH